MTDKEQKLYEILMRTIYAKEHGNVDEHDVQRVLGALYQNWKERTYNDR